MIMLRIVVLPSNRSVSTNINPEYVMTRNTKRVTRKDETFSFPHFLYFIFDTAEGVGVCSSVVMTVEKGSKKRTWKFK